VTRPPAWRELGEWVAYLREIGVRELELPPSPPRAAPERSPAAPAPTARPAVGKVRRSPPRSTAPPRVGDLFGDQAVPGFASPAPENSARRLAEIRDELGDCTRCKLHEGRTNIVFGVGNPQARLMFIGEGPGADEDLQGEPFVGRAGKKLDEMIAAIGSTREEVYIANVVKCRPPQNREPERDEVDTCSPFLIRQIEAIRPKVIVTLGAPATRTLLGTRIGITKLRGLWQQFRGIPVMPTFHPAYLLRAYTPENRRNVWEDLKAARARAEGDQE
jgi:DNA polymerase